ncbi:Glycosyl phosphatidyl inositol protein transamidase complex subunit [Mortierella hygrophila]|uniref:Glycosyl phosphatidyl inositol protein transamidase complex subunit n=1 Tax=Mortierella hygrophila TaxID=979708 RepID=A0A9P6EYK7_9FUNG|nr:Glycosyl phosphatidyl inositol protein transamidase complex subunit [Mortierella hygrophila]
MGFLSRLSKAQRQQIFGRFVLSWMPTLSYIMVAVSFFWLLALPHQDYSKRTYVSENALLPGSANVQFNWDDNLAAEAYRDTVQRIASLPSIERAQALELQFAAIGLKSATQNYTLSTSTESFHGVNTYAVFYAPRSDGTEALVLSASWLSRDKTTNTNAIAMLLALGKTFKRGSHFSKDIIFVVSDGEAEGLQAWLKAYHGNEEHTYERYEEPLRVRSGAIQAALNLDFAGTGDYNALGIFFEGVNGQLPNLDMINTINLISMGIAPVELTLHDELVPYTDNMTKNYLNSLRKMLYQMKYQAVGTPTGNHGLYLKYKIDAITLYGIDRPGWHSHRFNLFRVGALLESAVRSLNNLLEHLHQSFFFYLLSDVRRYTSIGLYMPPVIILGVSFIFQALSLWGLSSDLPLELESIVEGDTTIPVALPYSRRSRNFKVASSTMGMAMVTGAATFFLLTTEFGLVGESPMLKLVASVGVCSMLVLSAVSAAHVRTRIIKSASTVQKARASHNDTKGSSSSSSSNQSDNTYNVADQELTPAADWIMLKTLILALSALIVTTLSALNFSLAVSIGVLIVLPYMAFRPSRWTVVSIIEALILLAISPPGLMMVASWWYAKDPSEVLSWVLKEYEILGTWLLPTACFVYWPLNLAAVIMVLLPVS